MAGGNKKNNANSRLALIGITLVIILLACSVGLKSMRLRDQDAEYSSKEYVLEKELEKEQERTGQLEERRKYVSTLEYYKELAREKLGLVDPNEYRLKESE